MRLGVFWLLLLAGAAAQCGGELPDWRPAAAAHWRTADFWRQQLHSDGVDGVDASVCLALALLTRDDTRDSGWQALAALLQAHPQRLAADWVFWEALGAGYAAAARKILAQSPTASEALSSLAWTARAMETAWRARLQRGATAASDLSDAALAAYPQRLFDLPPTHSLRLWGDALQWSGQWQQAATVYNTGVQLGYWSTALCRPDVEHATIVPAAAPRYLFDARLFAYVAEPLQRGLAAVRSELAALGDADAWRVEQAGLHSGRTWSQLPLMVDGRLQPVCRSSLLQQTCRLVDSIAALKVRRGQVKLSRMLPGTHVRPHAGPVNERLRMHCTISAPPEPPAAWLRVGTEYAHWRQDHCFVFDESCEHEVNYPPRPDGRDRVVLIADFANPLLASVDTFLSVLRTDTDDQRHLAQQQYHAFQADYLSSSALNAVHQIVM